MLDMIPNEVSTQQWQDKLQHGDVVLFRFPHAEPGAPAEAPKSRPCLVLDVERRGGQLFVELAYGTSENTPANRGYKIHVNRTEGLAAAGLDRPTRFVCARRLIVSLNHAGFDVNLRHDGPVIGSWIPRIRSACTACGRASMPCATSQQSVAASGASATERRPV